MIFGIGVDIVSVERIKKNLTHYGDRFALRILADSEYEEFKAKQNKAHFLAKRFAAKEACVKAMGLGFREGISLKHIAVVNDHLGRPMLKLSGEAQRFIEQAMISNSFISLSDEDLYAIAYVVLTK